MERLRGQDAYFLYRETKTAHMHTLKVAVCEPPELPQSFPEIVENVAKHVHLLPPLRRRLVHVPLGLHHPVWIEDPEFDLAYHVRRLGVPAPGGARELDQTIAEIASHPLDRSRPLWEIWVLDGLAQGRLAYVFKVHHAVADGAASAGLIMNSAGRSKEDEPVPPAEPWHPERVPGKRALLAAALRDHLRMLLHLPALVARSARSIGALTRWQRASRTRPPGLFDGPPTRFGRALGPRRSFATTSLPLADCKRVKAAFGVTLNDVFLALCGGAFRHYLAERGELPEGPLAASIPVSADAEPRLTGNRLAFLQTTLHCEIADPVARLEATRAVSDAAKQQLEVLGRDLMLEWMEYLPPWPYTWVRRLQQRLRLADRLPSPSTVVVSNVAGPRDPLWWSGSRMEALYSVGPLSEGMGLNLTVWSYRDRMNAAALADRDRVPDPEALLDALHVELAALCSAADAAEPR